MKQRSKTFLISKNHIALLEILKHTLFYAAPTLDCMDFDYQEVLSISTKHSILPLIYQYIKKRQDIQQQTINDIRSYVIHTLIRNERMMTVQNEVIVLLRQHHIRCAVLKGSSIAENYPNKDMRALGDIDILVEAERFDEACTLAGENGFVIQGSIDYHTSYIKNGAYIELHRAVSRFPDNEKGRYAEAFMYDACLHTIESCTMGESYPTLDMIYQLVSLLAHMEKHIISGGIGLRQMCDWAVTVNHYADSIDQDCLDILDKCGLLRFAQVITKACSLYLGLSDMPWAADVNNTAVYAFFHDVLSTGNITGIDIERNLSTSFAFERKKDAKKRTLALQYILNINKRVSDEHPSLHNLWFIMPLFWVFYPFRYIIRSLYGKRRKIRVKNIISIAVERKKLYNELRLYQ